MPGQYPHADFVSLDHPVLDSAAAERWDLGRDPLSPGRVVQRPKQADDVDRRHAGAARCCSSLRADKRVHAVATGARAAPVLGSACTACSRGVGRLPR